MCRTNRDADYLSRGLAFPALAACRSPASSTSSAVKARASAGGDSAEDQLLLQLQQQSSQLSCAAVMDEEISVAVVDNVDAIAVQHPAGRLKRKKKVWVRPVIPLPDLEHFKHPLASAFSHSSPAQSVDAPLARVGSEGSPAPRSPPATSTPIHSPAHTFLLQHQLPRTTISRSTSADIKRATSGTLPIVRSASAVFRHGDSSTKCSAVDIGALPPMRR